MKYISVEKIVKVEVLDSENDLVGNKVEDSEIQLPNSDREISDKKLNSNKLGKKILDENKNYFSLQLLG